MARAKSVAHSPRPSTVSSVSDSDLSWLIAALSRRQTIEAQDILPALHELQRRRSADTNRAAGQLQATRKRLQASLDREEVVATRERDNRNTAMQLARRPQNDAQATREEVHIARCASRRLVRALQERRGFLAQLQAVHS